MLTDSEIMEAYACLGEAKVALAKTADRVAEFERCLREKKLSGYQSGMITGSNDKQREISELAHTINEYHALDEAKRAYKAQLLTTELAQLGVDQIRLRVRLRALGAVIGDPQGDVLE